MRPACYTRSFTRVLMHVPNTRTQHPRWSLCPCLTGGDTSTGRPGSLPVVPSLVVGPLTWPSGHFCLCGRLLTFTLLPRNLFYKAKKGESLGEFSFWLCAIYKQTKFRSVVGWGRLIRGLLCDMGACAGPSACRVHRQAWGSWGRLLPFSSKQTGVLVVTRAVMFTPQVTVVSCIYCSKCSIAFTHFMVKKAAAVM